jgi:proline dehydrogenase
MTASLLQRMIVAPLPYVPKPIVWRFSRRYVAGVDLVSAFDVVRALNRQGCSATIDVLGEDSTTHDEVNTARDLYLEALEGIRDQRLDCNVSVKLSDMGLRFDEQRCQDVLREIVDSASAHGNFVRIDMEDSSVTSVTLEIYRRLRERRDNVGAVIQSCLRRSPGDVRRLLDAGTAHVRLCKGIYIEPEDVAWTDPGKINDAYRGLLEQLFEGGAEKVGIATHDPSLAEHAEATIRRLGIDRSRYEFQMLLGVAGALRDRLVRDGHPLRVYVPFGERWHAYSMRRLRENPGIATHIVRNLFRRS